MIFTIHKDKEPDRVFHFGAKTKPPSLPNRYWEQYQDLEEQLGRQKMADDKWKDETGVEKVSQEPVKQGPVGTGAREPERPRQPEEGVKIGSKEERENA